MYMSNIHYDVGNLLHIPARLEECNNVDGMLFDY